MTDPAISRIAKSFSAPSSQRKNLVGADPGDFFAPFFDIVIYKATSDSPTEVFDLGADGNEGQPAEFGKRPAGAGAIQLSSVKGQSQIFSPDAGLEIRNFRSSLTIEARAAAAYRATVTLQPPYFDAINLIDSHLITFGALMEVQWGYLGSDGTPIVSDKGLFSIIQPSVRLGSQVTITISGWDKIATNGSRTDTRCAWERKKYDTDLKIVQALVKKIAGDGASFELGDVDDSHPLQKKKEGQPLIQATDDYTFLRRVLLMNDCSFQMNGGKLRLVDEQKAARQNPAYTLMWYGQPSGPKEIPMISYESNSIPALFDAQGSTGIKSHSFNLNKDEANVTDSDPADSGPQPADKKKLATQKGGAGGARTETSLGSQQPRAVDDTSGLCASGRMWVVPDERANQEQERENKARYNRRFANTRANVIIPGHPVVLPLMMVAVKGVGKEFSGNYRILKAAHEVGTSGYITKLDLLRAATSGDCGSPDPDAKEAGAASTEPSNPEGGSQDVDPVQHEPLTRRNTRFS